MVTIAGPFSFTVCRPPSTSRVTLKSEPSTSSLEAKVACGQPSSAASIWPVWLLIVVDRLLAEDDQAGLLLVDDGLEDLGDRQRLDIAFGLHQDAAVGAHGERGADGFRGLRRADRHHDDLGGLAGFLQAERFFDRDFVERIHRHLDVGEFDARAVALDADFDVVVDHPLYGHQNLHRSSFA